MKKVLMIHAEREGYAPYQVGSTCTVGELIEYLSDYPEDMEVYLKHDNGYTYGGVHAEDEEMMYMETVALSRDEDEADEEEEEEEETLTDEEVIDKVIDYVLSHHGLVYNDDEENHYHFFWIDLVANDIECDIINDPDWLHEHEGEIIAPLVDQGYDVEIVFNGSDTFIRFWDHKEEEV